LLYEKNFGESLGLETFEDEIRNVIIRKPATAGMENRKPIVMQGHLDMVHQKTEIQPLILIPKGSICM
jgi:dipeptidase D